MFSPCEKSPVNMEEIALHKVSSTPVIVSLDSEDTFVKQVGFDGNLVITFCFYRREYTCTFNFEHTYVPRPVCVILKTPLLKAHAWVKKCDPIICHLSCQYV